MLTSHLCDKSTLFTRVGSLMMKRQLSVKMDDIILKIVVHKHDKRQEVCLKYESPRDKTNKVSVCPAKTQISLGMHPV